LIAPLQIRSPHVRVGAFNEPIGSMTHALSALRSSSKVQPVSAEAGTTSVARKGQVNVRRAKRADCPADVVLQAADPPPVDVPNPLTADGLTIGPSDPATDPLADTADPWADPTVSAAANASDPAASGSTQAPANPRTRKRVVRPKIPGTIERAYRMRVYPTRDQEHQLSRLLGATRFVWNWALERRTTAYRTEGIELDWMMLSGEMTELRRAPATAWLSEMPREPFNQVLRNHDKAFAAFFKHRAKYPQFHSRRSRTGIRFTLDQRRQQVTGLGINPDAGTGISTGSGVSQSQSPGVHVGNDPHTHTGAGPGPKKTNPRWAYVSLPGLGTLKLRRTEALLGCLRSITLRQEGHAWVATITADGVPMPTAKYTPALATNSSSALRPAIGVDVGMKTWVVRSDGVTVAIPDALQLNQARLRRYQRHFSRQQDAAIRRHGLDPKKPLPKGTHLTPSNRMRQTQYRLGRIHARIAALRRQLLHQLTTDLVRSAQVIAIEDLALRAMGRGMGRGRGGKGFRRNLGNVAFGELRRQITYKAQWAQRQLVVVDRWFPSSKTCSACGAINRTLTLQQRSWECPACHAVHDRDRNAALNLECEGLRLAAIAAEQAAAAATTATTVGPTTIAAALFVVANPADAMWASPEIESMDSIETEPMATVSNSRMSWESCAGKPVRGPYGSDPSVHPGCRTANLRSAQCALPSEVPAGSGD